MAPTWLPKNHSPTAIKATKSWIYSHYSQTQKIKLFFSLCRLCAWRRTSNMHLTSYLYSAFRMDMFCYHFAWIFAVESFFYSNTNCIEHFSSSVTKVRKREMKWNPKKTQPNLGEKNSVFCSGCHGIFRPWLKTIVVVSVWISIAMKSTHNDQSTKVYSTERDEVH